MTLIDRILSRIGTAGSLIKFLWKRKLYWLIPLVIVLMIFAVLIILASSGLGPLIYPFI